MHIINNTDKYHCRSTDGVMYWSFPYVYNAYHERQYSSTCLRVLRMSTIRPFFVIYIPSCLLLMYLSARTKSVYLTLTPIYV
jgi:hypothetical protein